MNVFEDNLKQELENASKFFNVRLWSEHHNKIWLKTLAMYKITEVSQAFNDYYEIGQYMPKPADIIKLIKSNYKPPAQAEAEADELRSICPIIHTAWVRFNKLQNLFELSLAKESLSMTDDQAILICNMEARRLNYPAAIKESFWLDNIWGQQHKSYKDKEMFQLLDKNESYQPFDNNAPDYSDMLT